MTTEPTSSPAALEVARKRFTVAYNLAGWDGDWEIAANAANAYIAAQDARIRALEAERDAAVAALSEATLEFLRSQYARDIRAWADSRLEETDAKLRESREWLHKCTTERGHYEALLQRHDIPYEHLNVERTAPHDGHDA